MKNIFTEFRHIINKKKAENHAKLTKKTGKKVQALRVVVLGGGSFGTAMANAAARNGCDATLWVRGEADVKQMQKSFVNKKYLPKYKLEKNLQFTSNISDAVAGKDIIFVAIPSYAFRSVIQDIAPLVDKHYVVSLTKGIEPVTFALMSDIIKEEIPHAHYGVMSGPNLAKEIMDDMPAASVIASDSEELRNLTVNALHSQLFRVFHSDDIQGVELGGALKNIYAIAMGMASAYGAGENSRSMLITRALAEMSRFAVKRGANPLTFLGLSGVGDMYATCNSSLSRNFRMGEMLGKGYSIEEASKNLGQTAEGVNTIAQVYKQALELDVYMPITFALHKIIYEGVAPIDIAYELMEQESFSSEEFVLASNETQTKHYQKLVALAKDRWNAVMGSAQ